MAKVSEAKLRATKKYEKAGPQYCYLRPEKRR